MAKRSSPALYELIQHRTGERVPPAREHAEPRERTPMSMPRIGTWLQPGRSVQFPIGYLFVAVALALLLVIAGYAIGFHRGRVSERIIFEDEFGAVAATRSGAPLQDPLLRQENTSGQSPTAAGSEPRPRPRSDVSTAGWGPIDSDPRVKGESYFILAETTEAGAMRLADFCREHGLETYVVSGNTTRLRRVIALPGFDPDRVSSRQANELRERINAIGRRWEQESSGRWDYHTAYLSQY